MAKHKVAYKLKHFETCKALGFKEFYFSSTAKCLRYIQEYIDSSDTILDYETIDQEEKYPIYEIFHVDKRVLDSKIEIEKINIL